MKYKITSECIGCSLCFSECRAQAIEAPFGECGASPQGDAIAENGQRYKIQEAICNGCAECVEICPRGAIVKSGLVEVHDG